MLNKETYTNRRRLLCQRRGAWLLIKSFTLICTGLWAQSSYNSRWSNIHRGVYWDVGHASRSRTLIKTPERGLHRDIASNSALFPPQIFHESRNRLFRDIPLGKYYVNYDFVCLFYANEIMFRDKFNIVFGIRWE